MDVLYYMYPVTQLSVLFVLLVLLKSVRGMSFFVVRKPQYIRLFTNKSFIR